MLSGLAWLLRVFEIRIGVVVRVLVVGVVWKLCVSRAEKVALVVLFGIGGW